MNYLICECGYEEAVPNEEERRPSEERCPDCGKVGTLKEEWR